MGSADSISHAVSSTCNRVKVLGRSVVAMNTDLLVVGVIIGDILIHVCFFLWYVLFAIAQGVGICLRSAVAVNYDILCVVVPDFLRFDIMRSTENVSVKKTASRSELTTSLV